MRRLWLNNIQYKYNLFENVNGLDYGLIYS